MENLPQPTIKKTPVSYYGGKQQLVKYILPLVLAATGCTTYIETFAGGAAVFFAKPEHKVEVINDLNGEISNFYKVLKTDFASLKIEIDTTLYSRSAWQQAMIIYDNPDLFTPVQRAWGFFIATQQGFSNKIGSWGVERSGDKQVRNFQNKKDAFCLHYSKRLEHVQIESMDAVQLITKRDDSNVLFYCDPPYINSNCGHYSGYKTADYIELLDALSKIKGKFILSSYPNESLDIYIEQFKWRVISVDQPLRVSGKRKKSKRKTELIICNF